MLAIMLHFACTVHAHSPETEVADMLRSLGDRVNEKFGDILSEAVAAVVSPQEADRDITYVVLQSAAESLIERVHPGWSQVLVAVWIFLFLTDNSLNYCL